MGEIMELIRNLSVHQCVPETPTQTLTASTLVRSCTLMHIPARARTDAHKTAIRIEWILKLLLTLSTYDPLSITQMDTTLSYWSRPLLFHFFVALVVFHLVTSPLICIALLMVSVAIDGTINQRPRLEIITTETNWAHTPRPWKPQMSSLGMIHTPSDMHNRCPLAQVHLLGISGRQCVYVCVWDTVWVTRAVMESLPWCEVIGPFQVPSSV